MENKFPGKDVSEEDIAHKLPLVSSYDVESSATSAAFKELVFGRNPIVAGPNTLETEFLLGDILENLLGVTSLIRAGIYKPLSFPYRSEKYFEPGDQAIEWLVRAKGRAKAPFYVVSEVMTSEQIFKTRDAIDVLQIGSRNMQNYPLLIDAAADGRPIVLKRHYGASLRDFLAAAEYLLFHGATELILCERGMAIPHTHRATSRFALDLQVVPAIRELTNIPVMADPSHATFWRSWVPSMAYAAVASGVHSLMLEVHPIPEEAAVDPLQAINYETFRQIADKCAQLREILK